MALVPLVPVGVALAWIDLHTRLLPSRIVLPATAYAVLVALVLWGVSGDHDDVLRVAAESADAMGALLARLVRRL